MKKIITLIVMLCLLVIPAHAVDNLTIPNTFNPGETISSSQMNENFSRLIELVDNQSKTINNLESIINALISEFFTQHPRYVTLDYTNGDIGNCATNGLSYPNEVQCTDAVANNTLIDEMDDSQYNPRGCYYDGRWKFNVRTTSTAEISAQKTKQICINPNPSL